MSMLRARVATAVLLFAAFFCALFYLPSPGWLGVMALVAALAYWEWGGLMKLPGNRRVTMGVGMLAVILALAFWFPSAVGMDDGSPADLWRVGRWLYLPAAGFWLFVVPLWLKSRWSLSRPAIGYLAGVIVILPAWLALVQLRQLGGWHLLAIMAIVWLADIAAYFCGRALGRHKLAPSISPGKTWEGAVGGVLAVVGFGLAISPRLPPLIADRPTLLIIGLVLLAAISIVGDLFESLLKRQAGLKDSSNALPGHGGVLDRIDSLTSTLPLVALIWFGMGL